MGNLVRLEAAPGSGDPPDLRKGVISIFANLPADAVTAKRAEVQTYVDTFGGIPIDMHAVMFGVIPLITWGPQQTATIYELGVTDTIEVETNPPEVEPVDLTGVTGSHTNETPPSFIGVYVGYTGSPELKLIVHVQTQHGPSCTNTSEVQTGAHWDSGLGEIVYEAEDASYIDEAPQDYFGNARIVATSWDNAPFGRPDIVAGTEAKFNAIVAWDLTNGAASHGVAPDAEDEIGTSAGADTVSKLWCAIDGVNKNGHDLPAVWAYDDTESGDPNEILSWLTGAVSGKYGASTGVPSATLTMTETSIPFFPVAIPSQVSLMREGVSFVPNPLIREGRIQFFAGVSIDTSIEGNVTAFRLASGEPAPLSAARTLLSPAVPIVEFATATAIINGVNSGSVGNLTPDGTITEYNP